MATEARPHETNKDANTSECDTRGLKPSWDEWNIYCDNVTARTDGKKMYMFKNTLHFDGHRETKQLHICNART